jgi:colanic acid/amylovoran biosynthesis glycosyltransferase
MQTASRARSSFILLADSISPRPHESLKSDFEAWDAARRLARVQATAVERLMCGARLPDEEQRRVFVSARRCWGASSAARKAHSDLPTVLIFTQLLMPISQTFVSAQASALPSYKAQHAGLQPARPSLPMPKDAIYLAQPRSTVSRIRHGLYELTGIAPFFHQRLLSVQPALVHAHHAQGGTTILPFLRQLKIPLLVTLHGSDINVRDEYYARTLRGKIYLSRRSQLWARASAFICVSDFIRETAIARGFPPEKLRVHYIGVDRRKFAPSNAPRQPIVLFVGRLIEVKGCEYALRAMQRIGAVVPDARLVIIGEGPLRAQLEQLARELRIRSEFLGAQPHEAVRTWMRRARVVCTPSKAQPNGTAEGLPIGLLEAQASGTPVVAFRTGGIPEAIDDGVSGRIVPSGDIGQLAAALICYLSDDALWRLSSLAGPKWIAGRFDLHAQTAVLEKVYDDLCAAQ